MDSTSQAVASTHPNSGTRHTSAWPAGRTFAATVVLLVASCVVMLPNLSYPLIEPDESRYVQIALEMIETGDWTTPKLIGEPYFDKPPLLYWLTASSMKVLGKNEWAARLPCVASAIATILLTFLLGQRLVGQRAAWCAGLALLLSGGFVLSGRFLIMDSLLTLCTTVCLLAGYLAIRQPTFRWQWWALSSIACGFGILTKGPLAVLLCVPPMLVHQWLTNQRLSHGQSRIQFRHLAAFFVLVLLMTLPWFVAVSIRNSEFSAHFFWEHNVVRFTRAFNHHQPWWFYIPILFAGMFPTSLLLPSLGVFLFGRANANRRFRTPDMGYLLIGSAWVLLFFSCSACKLPTYILPAIPLLCLLTGAMLDHTVLKPDLVNAVTSFLKPFPQRATAIMLLMCVVVAFIDAVIMSGNHSVALIAFAIVLFTAVLTGMTWKKEIASSKLGWSFTVVVAIAVSVFAFGEFVPSISVSRSVLRRVASLHEQNERLPIVFFAEDSYAASMYVPDKQLVRYGKQEREAFAVFMASHPDAIVVTRPELAESAQDSVRSSCDLIARGGRRRVFLATSANAPSTRLANANDEKFD